MSDSQNSKSKEKNHRIIELEEPLQLEEKYVDEKQLLNKLKQSQGDKNTTKRKYNEQSISSFKLIKTCNIQPAEKKLHSNEYAAENVSLSTHSFNSDSEIQLSNNSFLMDHTYCKKQPSRPICMVQSIVEQPQTNKIQSVRVIHQIENTSTAKQITSDHASKNSEFLHDHNYFKQSTNNAKQSTSLEIIDLHPLQMTLENSTAQHRQSLKNIKQPSITSVLCNNDSHNNSSSKNENIIAENYIGKMDLLCSVCKAKHFKGEKVANKKSFDDCCNHGKVQLDALPELPHELKLLFNGSHEKSNHFFKHIRQYNNSFSFASLNANIIPFNNRRPGPYCFKIQGQIYYQINTSLYPESHESPSYGQLFIYDGDEAVKCRSSSMNELDPVLLTTIDQIMRNNNIHAKSYMMMNEEIKIAEEKANANNSPIPDLQLIFTLKQGLDPNRYNIQRFNEVAAIFTTTADGEIPDSYVSIRNKNTKDLKYINSMNPNVEPWTYPLYFPYGTQGWHENLTKLNTNRRVTRLNYIRYRIAIRDDEFNPLIMGRRLYQQYLVDSYVKIERDRINYCKSHQAELRRDSYQGLIDHLNSRANSENKRVGKIVILPSTFSGSPRNMIQKYQDAMTISYVKGQPDIFLTMTCNPNWREIQENLLPGQQACDRPDICARVFDLKVKALLDIIVEKKFFGDVAAYVYTIEFQKRGLPHVHLLITLKPGNKINTVEAVDKYISAEIPDPQKNHTLHQIVMKHMIHGPCGDWCLVDGKCSKHFPKSYQKETLLDADNYPYYRRRNNGKSYERPGNYVVDNRHVVPYCPELLLLFNCHMNTMVVMSTKSIKYLFKYVMKGHDAAAINISNVTNDPTINNNSTIDHDEIQMYLESRYVSPIEAAWRILSLTMHQKSHAVIRLPVHLPNLQFVTVDADLDENNIENIINQSTMLLAYFNLNKEDIDARNYKYVQIPQYYTFKSMKINGSKVSFWEKRKNRFNCLGRIYSVSPSAVELYHLRILLLTVKGATSFEDLRTVNGITYETFVQTCLALGLIEDDEEWKRAMQEAVFWMMPQQLRRLFARILIYCNPLHPTDLWNEFKSFMSEDFIHKSLNTVEAEKRACLSIDNILRTENKNLKEFIDVEIFEKENDSTLFDDRLTQSLLNIGKDLYVKLNDEQKCIVDLILNQVKTNINVNNNKPNNCFFINGPGGSGKTFIYKTLYHLLSGNGKNVCSMAFTGIAAILLPCGKTVHRTFQLPVPLYSDSTSRIKVQSKEAEYLRSIDVFIWDEAPMAPRYALEVIDKTLRDITNKNILFGGKIFVLGGDFRQLLPIQLQSTRTEIVNLSIKNSSIWKNFKDFKLCQNMRTLDNEKEFSKFLLKIGDGTLNDENDNIKLSHFPSQCILGNDTDIVDEIYGSVLRNKNYREAINFAILSARNDDVNELNEKVLDLLDKSTEQIYTSIDTTENCDNGVLNETLSPEYLNTLSPPSLPPHEIRLRINAVVILIRNLSIDEGLCNGTRLLILKMSGNVLCCEILTGDKAGQVVFLSRITLYSENDYPFTFKRRQFPIKLAFAMTINKSQGQTFNKIGLDLRRDVFNHGQLYVALSRVKSWDGVKIFLNNNTNQRDSIKNYVFKEMFD